eukprot:sb/3477963/
MQDTIDTYWGQQQRRTLLIPIGASNNVSRASNLSYVTWLRFELPNPHRLLTYLDRTILFRLAEKKDPPITTEDMSTDQSSQMATLAATAAWRLSRWNDLEKYTG